MNAVRIHWSFWLVCVLALAWNVMGSMNYVMQINPEMLAKYPEAAKSLVASRPAWATGAFAIAVFGGVISDIHLLPRRASAYYLFVASLIGGIVTNIHTAQVTSAPEIWIGSIMSLVAAAFLIMYSKLVEAKGWMH